MTAESNRSPSLVTCEVEYKKEQKLNLGYLVTFFRVYTGSGLQKLIETNPIQRPRIERRGEGTRLAWRSLSTERRLL